MKKEILFILAMFAVALLVFWGLVAWFNSIGAAL